MSKGKGKGKGKGERAAVAVGDRVMHADTGATGKVLEIKESPDGDLACFNRDSDGAPVERLCAGCDVFDEPEDGAEQAETTTEPEDN